MIPIKRLKNIESEIKWIYLGTESKNGMQVSRIIPKGFKGYVKVFQPIFRDKNITDESLTFEDFRKQDEKEGFQFAIDYKNPFTYKTLAKKYNIPYTAEICVESFVRHFGGSLARYIIFSDEGDLDTKIVKKLVRVLKNHTNGKCYFYYDVISYLSEERLYYGNIGELFALIKETGYAPNYWWVEDRSWVIGINHDLEFTLLGGSQKLVDAIMKIKDVECMRVEQSTIVHKWH